MGLEVHLLADAGVAFWWWSTQRLRAPWCLSAKRTEHLIVNRVAMSGGRREEMVSKMENEEKTSSVSSR